MSQSLTEPSAAPAAAPVAMVPPIGGEVVLPLEDAAYTNSEQALRMLPRTTLVWDDVRTLLGVATRLLGPHDSAQLAALVLDSLLSATPAETVALSGVAAASAATGTVSKSRSAETVDTTEPLSPATQDLALRASNEKAGILAFGESTAICVPLVYQDRVLGVVALESSSAAAARLDKHHLQLAIGIAVLAAPALAAAEVAAATAAAAAPAAAAPAKRTRKPKASE